MREPFSAVRLIAEALDLPSLYNLRPAELAAALGDDEEPLTPHGVCVVLAERKNYRIARGRGAPDVHRAGLEVLRDCVDGVLCLSFEPPDDDDGEHGELQPPYGSPTPRPMSGGSAAPRSADACGASAPWGWEEDGEAEPAEEALEAALDAAEEAVVGPLALRSRP